jgi:hypothetical protein
VSAIEYQTIQVAVDAGLERRPAVWKMSKHSGDGIVPGDDGAPVTRTDAATP